LRRRYFGDQQNQQATSRGASDVTGRRQPANHRPGKTCSPSRTGHPCRPGDRPHLFYQLRVYRRRKGEAKGFTWIDYRDLLS
jgi:hypothetical protein